MTWIGGKLADAREGANKEVEERGGELEGETKVDDAVGIKKADEAGVVKEGGARGANWYREVSFDRVEGGSVFCSAQAVDALREGGRMRLGTREVVGGE